MRPKAGPASPPPVAAFRYSGSLGLTTAELTPFIFVKSATGPLHSGPVSLSLSNLGRASLCGFQHPGPFFSR